MTCVMVEVSPVEVRPGMALGFGFLSFYQIVAVVMRAQHVWCGWDMAWGHGLGLGFLSLLA